MSKVTEKKRRLREQRGSADNDGAAAPLQAVVAEAKVSEANVVSQPATPKKNFLKRSRKSNTPASARRNSGTAGNRGRSNDNAGGLF